MAASNALPECRILAIADSGVYQTEKELRVCCWECGPILPKSWAESGASFFLSRFSASGCSSWGAGSIGGYRAGLSAARFHPAGGWQNACQERFSTPALTNSLYGRHGATGVIDEGQKSVQNQMRFGAHGIASSKLVCIDLQPYSSTQAPDRSDTLNIGGFSDGVLNPVTVLNTVAVFNPVAVFNTVAVFNPVAVLLTKDTGRFVAEVQVVEL